MVKGLNEHLKMKTSMERKVRKLLLVCLIDILFIFVNLKAPNIRRLFSSEEDLEEMPPNFFYSTARLSHDFNKKYSILWGDNKGIDRIR